MTPLFLGTASRRLFGLYTPALATVPGRAFAGASRAVVLCPPWGREYLCAHRSLRQLGNMLAGSGFHVMRFDYFGTGDSGGDMPDADLDGWTEDVVAAIEELKDTCDAKKVSLVGLRLGAVLAARATTRHARDVDALVLWDPIVSGARYLAELDRSVALESGGKAARAPRLAEAGGGVEVHGFPLTDRLGMDIGAIDLGTLMHQVTCRTLAVVSQSAAECAPLQACLDGCGEPSKAEWIKDFPAWVNHTDSGAGAVPVKVLQRIVQWLEA
jgi:pimeloyl-ACP methyl ester carboxylesterase